jgi:hypothetical protein
MNRTDAQNAVEIIFKNVVVLEQQGAYKKTEPSILL